MNLIVAADERWGIGKDGGLLAHLPGDMKYFRETTRGKVVVMGRKTLESFPGGQPLKNRRNIVLTRNPEYSVKGAEVVRSPEELLKLLEGSPLEDVYVIGGGEVYRQLLPYCDTVYVTKIDFAYQADTFFPNLDESPEWELAEESEEQTCFDIEFTFRTYRRI